MYVKLSDAIMLGSAVVPALPMREWHSGGGGCARGMALEAIGKRVHNGNTNQNVRALTAAWPWTERSECVLPCKCGSSDLWSTLNIIAHIFDQHVMGTAGAKKDWTLPQLVAWVRSVEPTEEMETQHEEQTTEVQCEFIA